MSPSSCSTAAATALLSAADQAANHLCSIKCSSSCGSMLTVTQIAPTRRRARARRWRSAAVAGQYLVSAKRVITSQHLHILATNQLFQPLQQKISLHAGPPAFRSAAVINIFMPAPGRGAGDRHRFSLQPVAIRDPLAKRHRRRAVLRSGLICRFARPMPLIPGLNGDQAGAALPRVGSILCGTAPPSTRSWKVDDARRPPGARPQPPRAQCALTLS